MKAAWVPFSLREGVRCPCSTRSILSRPSLRQRVVLNSFSKQFSSSSRLRTGFAAPEITFPSSKSRGNNHGNAEEDDQDGGIFYARLVPESPSYFSGQPFFTDSLLSLQALLRKHSALPVVRPGEAPRVAWRTLIEYRNMTGETIQASKYHKIVAVLRRLNHIHPSLMPADVKATLNEYKRGVNPHENKPTPITIDRFGRAVGSGRRKSSSATAFIVEGNGEVLVNGKSLADAFARVHDRESVIWALKATDRVDKYNVWGIVSGGGTTGQAEALTLAVAKALMVHEPSLKPALRRAGCVTRDPRRVERKKPGHLKARKKPAWVKR